MKFLLRKKKRNKRIILRPFGQVYNLQEIYNEVNEKYFDAKLSLRISWFGRGETVPKTRITFGSYNPNFKLIKVNRLLDKEHIPEYFVRFIVYHEMLHDAVPPKRKKRGTHHIHHKEFKAKEREFPEFSEVNAFIQKWKKEHFAPSS
ncbi:MAG: hypothetical protein P0S96_00280 [Simkaniaceae bacterium]|nr:hypothetical protein [Candidatus Sacchlamyda saccharinae]